jgi:O-antigen ligase
MPLRLTRWALAVTAAAMPLYVVRWHIGPVPTTLLEVLILLTLAIYVVSLLLRQAPLPGLTRLEIPIALFLLAGVIGILVAPDHRGALGIFRAYLVEPIAMYFVAVAVLTDLVAVEQFLAGWSVGALLFAGDEIFRFGQALAANVLHPGHAQAALNINPNSVALFIEPLLAVAAGLALFTTGRRRIIAMAVGVVLGLAEVATLSRGGLLALGAMAVVAVLTIPSVRLRIAIAVAAIVAAAGVFVLPVLGPRVESTLNENGTFTLRLHIWAASLRMLRDHPIFGAGLNAYQTVMAPYRAPDPRLYPQPYPHNIFLTSWTELGVLGLAAFIYIVVFLIATAYAGFVKATGIERALLWGSGVAFVVILVHGMVDSPYWKNDLSLEFWMLAAVQVVILRLGRRAATV